MYRPAEMSQMTTPVKLLKAETKNVLGVIQKSYVEVGMILCNFKTYGGTEKMINDMLAIEDTADIVTWYNPDIKSDCIIETQDGLRYEILGSPENIEMRNQVMKFKVRRITGGT